MVAALYETIQQGGWIMWPIIGVSFIVWFLGLYKLTELWQVSQARSRFLAYVASEKVDAHDTGLSAYDALLQHLGETPSAENFSLLFREFLFVARAQMNRGLNTIAVWVSVAPLLGLLGTVVGMIETFRVITVFGAGNPTLTAEGISIALLTTEAGLTVAFPGMLLYTFVVNRKSALQKSIICDGEVLLRKCTDKETVLRGERK